MTAKQKANQARFKAVIAEAKKLRKKNPSLNQAQAVKQAWAIMYGKKRAGKKVGETHKDTKSHNVNIRVVSGIGADDRWINYLNDFYGKNGSDKKYSGFTKDQIKKLSNAFLKKISKSRTIRWGGGDSIDRENFRDAMLAPKIIAKKAMKKNILNGWKKGKTKFVEKGEKKPKTRSFRVNRSAGEFKSFSRIISGIGDIGKHFTRVRNDVNGNPRYAVHFIALLNDEERLSIPFNEQYNYAVKKAKKIGGRRFHNKQYGGGIVFQSYNIEDTWKNIQRVKESSIPW